MTSMTMGQTGAAANGSAAAMVAAPTERVRRAVFVITERMTAEGLRSFWTRVGAAFENRDGSVTIKLDALPLSGTLQVRDDDRDQRKERANAAPF